MKKFLICAWILIVFAVGANAENLRVRLRAEVTVQHETLRLSDLLPANAGTRLNAAAERVSLGRAPQAGSLRVFTASALRQAIAKIPLYTSEIYIPEQVIVRHIGWPLNNLTITQTLGQSKLTHAIDISKAKIVLPPGFTTVTHDPQFEVTALNASSGHRQLLVSMRCRERAACGSFLTEVLDVPAEGVPSQEFKFASEKVAQPGLLSVSGPVLVHPGRLALLVIEGNGIRITQPVMVLKRARLGELVRVSDPRTHRSWLAQVSGNGTLRPATRNEEAR